VVKEEKKQKGERERVQRGKGGSLNDGREEKTCRGHRLGRPLPGARQFEEMQGTRYSKCGSSSLKDNT